KATGLKPKQISAQAPWQNGVAKRWVGSCRREILDHVIALNEQHLRRLIREYVKLPPPRPHPRCPGEGRSESPSDRVQTVTDCDRDLKPTTRWTPSSVLLAASSLGPGTTSRLCLHRIRPRDTSCSVLVLREVYPKTVGPSASFPRTSAVRELPHFGSLSLT